MSEDKRPKERFGVPKYYYWAKNPPKPSYLQTTKFVNSEQRKFYWVTLGFTIAKVAAIALVFLLMLGAI